MRKILVIVICFIFIMSGCSFHNYSDWKTVKVESAYSFMIPGEWKQGEQNGLAYFYDPNIKDEGDNICLILSESRSNIQGEWKYFDLSPREEKGKVETNILGEFQSFVITDVKTTSIGNSYGHAVYSVDGYTYLDSAIWTDNSYVTLYGWHNRVDDSTLKKIADSFILYDNIK